ncbi:hypothetical protein NUW58_g3048 [Xylaria curta]|uniref:Uncharacterized protein n=1 Tax=Xylaria curta TaxID=42375 RepID=A0ACC1PDY4_9PEZI|nr:hypothetical protein NUW58_g3048 [Xylaria curta]
MKVVRETNVFDNPVTLETVEPQSTLWTWDHTSTMTVYEIEVTETVISFPTSKPLEPTPQTTVYVIIFTGSTEHQSVLWSNEHISQKTVTITASQSIVWSNEHTSQTSVTVTAPHVESTGATEPQSMVRPDKTTLQTAMYNPSAMETTIGLPQLTIWSGGPTSLATVYVSGTLTETFNLPISLTADPLSSTKLSQSPTTALAPMETSIASLAVASQSRASEETVTEDITVAPISGHNDYTTVGQLPSTDTSIRSIVVISTATEWTKTDYTTTIYTPGESTSYPPTMAIPTTTEGTATYYITSTYTFAENTITPSTAVRSITEDEIPRPIVLSSTESGGVTITHVSPASTVTAVPFPAVPPSIAPTEVTVTVVSPTSTRADTPPPGILSFTGPVDPTITFMTPTATLTDIPPGFSVQTLTGLTYWGWVTTTRDDDSTTVVPVVAGNIVWELPPVPRVQFYFPQFHLPRFHLPCIRFLFIRIGECDDPPTPDPDPNDEPESSAGPTKPQPQTKSSSCTETQIVSNCEVSCSVTTANPSSTSTLCYSTRCSTTTLSCSSTAITSTTVVTNGCAMTIMPPSVAAHMPAIPWDSPPEACYFQCPVFNEWEADLDDPDEWIDPSDNGNSSPTKLIDLRLSWWARAFTSTSVRVQNGNPVSKVGLSARNCYITDSSPVPGTPKVVATPRYVRGNSLLSYDLAGTVTELSILSRWLKTTSDVNCKPSLLWVDASAISSDTSLASAAHVGPRGVEQSTFPSVDHTFENRWLHEFFAYIINVNAQPMANTFGLLNQLNCDDLLYLMYGGMPGNRVRNYFKRVFDSLAGWDHLEDMVGMNKAANAYAKSFVLTVDRLQNDLNRVLGPNYATYYGSPWEGDILGPSPGYKNILEEKLRYWQNIYLGVKIINDPVIQTSIKRTALRILDTWIQIDNELSCEAAYQDGRWSFAPKFIAFMGEYTSFLTAPSALNDKMQLLVAHLYHDLIIATTEASSGRFTEDQVKEVNAFVKKWNALVTVADPMDPTEGTSKFLWTIDWNWPILGLSDDGVNVCTMTPAGNSLTATGSTASTISSSPASPMPSLTNPFTASTVIITPVTSTAFIPSPTLTISMPLATPIACTDDSQCIGVCPTSQVDRCEIYGLGEHAYGTCGCASPTSQLPTISFCSEDAQCTGTCAIGQADLCETYGLGEYAYGRCTCQPTSIDSTMSASTMTIPLIPLTSSSTAPASPSQPPPPPPSTTILGPPPAGNCYFKYSILALTFKITHVNGWAGVDGTTLRNEVKGCGAVTDWTWSDLDSDSQVIFMLPTLFKGGCVEDAISTAGGPRLICEYQGWGSYSHQVISVHSLDKLEDSVHLEQ